VQTGRLLYTTISLCDARIASPRRFCDCYDLIILHGDSPIVHLQPHPTDWRTSVCQWHSVSSSCRPSNGSRFSLSISRVWGLVWFISRHVSTKADYIDDRSQIQVHNDERAEDYSAGLLWWLLIQVLRVDVCLNFSERATVLALIATVTPKLDEIEQTSVKLIKDWSHMVCDKLLPLLAVELSRLLLIQNGTVCRRM